MMYVDLGAASGYLIFALIFAAYFLAFEAIFLGYARRSAVRGDVAKRLVSSVRGGSEQRQALIKTRHDRSLSADGDFVLPVIWLNRLVAQSGVKLGVSGLPLAVAALGAGIGIVTLVVTGSLMLAVPVGFIGGAGIPVVALMYVRQRRLQRFEAQLPDAVDTLVRSLRAGHPVQAAVRMIVREMPEPIGPEFAIVADELTYGLDLETAMKNLHRRVGQQDLGLLVAAIGLQSKTGGSMAEMLGNLAGVVRQRLRMRLKVKALSAEARFSAMVLSVLPVALFLILGVISPSYYGAVWDVAFVKPVLGLAFAWMIVGDVIMYRMVRFEV